MDPMLWPQRPFSGSWSWLFFFFSGCLFLSIGERPWIISTVTRRFGITQLLSRFSPAIAKPIARLENGYRRNYLFTFIGILLIIFSYIFPIIKDHFFKTHS